LPGSQLVVFELDHTTAPIDLRERVAFADPGVPTAPGDLTGLDDPLVDQAAILSTCNRVEVYGVARSLRSREELTSFLARYHGLDPNELKSSV
jgi:glutamyl-tRNA reductase